MPEPSIHRMALAFVLDLLDDRIKMHQWNLERNVGGGVMRTRGRLDEAEQIRRLIAEVKMKAEDA